MPREQGLAPKRIIKPTSSSEGGFTAAGALDDAVGLFEHFMRNLPGLAWVKDVNGSYVYANDAAQAAFGLPRSGLYGRSDDEIFPPETAAQFKANDQRALAESRGVQTIETLEHPDGSRHYSLVNKFPIMGADGRAMLIGGIAIDITEQRRAEVALLAKEVELQLIAETTPLALVRCGRDLRFKYINRAGAGLLGHSASDISGKRIVDVMGKKAFAQVRPMIDRVLNGETVEFESQVAYPTGPRWVRVSYRPERSDDGEVIGWIATVMDISELKAAELASRQYQQQLQDMLITLEHRVAERTRDLYQKNAELQAEIRARILGEEQRIALLGRLVESQEAERRRIARDIHDQLGQEMTGLRLELESLIRETGRGSVEASLAALSVRAERLDRRISSIAWQLRPVLLDDLGLVEAFRVHTAEWSTHSGIAAEFHASRIPRKRLPHEIETHLYRICQEALNNVAKHSRASRAAILLERRGRIITLIIEDNGRGFDPVSIAQSKKHSGGLGLLGMQERAALVGGTLEIESAPRQGTTIFVRIPV